MTCTAGIPCSVTFDGVGLSTDDSLRLVERSAWSAFSCLCLQAPQPTVLDTVEGPRQCLAAVYTLKFAQEHSLGHPLFQRPGGPRYLGVNVSSASVQGWLRAPTTTVNGTFDLGTAEVRPGAATASVRDCRWGW